MLNSSVTNKNMGLNVLDSSRISGKKKNLNNVKNVILLIGDGMGFSYTTGLRYFNHVGKTGLMAPTLFDQFFVGTQSTYSLDPISNITDSAAAGTALSTGYKTVNGVIGLNQHKQMVPTILEHAKYQGKATGLVGTSQINHATLAAFASHQEDRNDYDRIADQYLDHRIENRLKLDVMLGGGTSYFNRMDRNLVEEFIANQFGYVETAQELKFNRDERLIGLFAPVELPKAIDRDASIPTLRQMTREAIHRLQTNSNGFFLLVEGSQIDWAAHDNDIVGAMSELKDFEGAFQEAIHFALDREDTLVVATADHSTGGMSLDRDGNFKWNPEFIKSVKATPRIIATHLHQTKNIESLREFIPTPFTESERELIEATFDVGIEETRKMLIQLINTYSSTGWTTNGHTGEDVPVYAYGLHRNLFNGRMENSDIAKVLFELMG